MTNVYIDSDVIVSAEIVAECNHGASKEFMEYVLKNDKSDITFCTSVFTFLELASAMMRRTNSEDKAYSLLYRSRNSWKKFVKPLPPLPPKDMTSVTRFVDSLIETSIRFHTPSGDTIHAQTIATHEIDYLVTWNKRHFSHLSKHLRSLKIRTPAEALDEFRRREHG